MCKPASFIVTKRGVFWSKRSDSHEQIIGEHKLEALDRDAIRGSQLVRIEIVPPKGTDFDTPLAKWIFHTDQQETPAWYEPEIAEKKCRAALKQWAKAKLVRTGEKRDVNEGDFVHAVCGGTVNEVRGGTINAVMGGTINAVCGGTINTVWGGTINTVRYGTINAVRGGTVRFRMSFKVKLSGLFAVVIKGFGNKAKCYVGTKKVRIIKG